ncbi:hypothetical protein GQ55_2G484700 [Panicum hallii var. hallii]|uniref:CASP-like protein n=1 Tax=Panicum hallii var. hallii TaxID=1504633 RepID=A0A2T7F0G1_9POAL|nr:hypothetical protein GQ55_2G484700 [Panicum hallii var. hallii]
MAAMAVVTSSSSPAYVAKQPPPPPPGIHHNKTAGYQSYNGHNHMYPPTATTTTTTYYWEERRALDGIVLALRAAAALLSFVAVALVASCRHGDWMEFARYQEYRYLLGASLVACLYSAAQAFRSFRRMRAAASTSGSGILHFAGDQVVAYLLITAASAALPITIRMRSAVINIFTDAMVAAISLAFAAFAALAFSAIISGFRISAAAAAAAQPY